MKVVYALSGKNVGHRQVALSGTEKFNSSYLGDGSRYRDESKNDFNGLTFSTISLDFHDKMFNWLHRNLEFINNEFIINARRIIYADLIIPARIIIPLFKRELVS